MTSYISNIKEIDFESRFKPLSINEIRQSLSQYLPMGKLFIAKDIPNSNLYKLLKGFAYSILRYQTFIKYVTEDYYIFKTVDLLERWEEALSIPDECFSIDVPIEQRRKQIITKLAIDNVNTKEDYKALAKFYGVNIKIENGFDVGEFPYLFPLTLSGNEKERRFTLIITFLNITVIGFPYEFPMTFDEFAYGFLKCLFNKIKPANVNIIYKYES